MTSVENAIQLLKPIEWQCNYPSIWIAITLSEIFSPDAVNAGAKLLHQQLFEALLWYYTSEDLGLHLISPVSFSFIIVTVKVGYLYLSWPVLWIIYMLFTVIKTIWEIVLSLQNKVNQLCHICSSMYSYHFYQYFRHIYPFS